MIRSIQIISHYSLVLNSFFLLSIALQPHLRNTIGIAGQLPSPRSSNPSPTSLQQLSTSHSSKPHAQPANNLSIPPHPSYTNHSSPKLLQHTLPEHVHRNVQTPIGQNHNHNRRILRNWTILRSRIRAYESEGSKTYLDGEER